MALEIEAELTDAGAVVVGPAGTLEAAARLIEAEPLDAALLDANLAGKPVDALAAALAARGVPFAFASGYGPSGLPEGFRDRPLLGKPFGAEALVALVRGLLAPAEGRRRSFRCGSGTEPTGVPRAERWRENAGILLISREADRPARRAVNRCDRCRIRVGFRRFP